MNDGKTAVAIRYGAIFRRSEPPRKTSDGKTHPAWLFYLASVVIVVATTRLFFPGASAAAGLSFAFEAHAGRQRVGSVPGVRSSDAIGSVRVVCADEIVPMATSSTTSYATIVPGDDDDGIYLDLFLTGDGDGATIHCVASFVFV